MAKKGIHPDYHEITVNTFNEDGSKLSFKSCSTIKGDHIDAEVNIFKHPAWKDDSKFDTENTVNKVALKFAQRLKKTETK